MSKTNNKKKIDSVFDRYTIIGIIFLVFGVFLSETFFLLYTSVPLIAVGISIVILGLTIMLVPNNLMPSHFLRSTITESYLNIEEILEQFEAKEKCIYLPIRENKVFAYIPLNGQTKSSRNTQALKALEAPIRLVTEVDGNPGLMIFLPISHDFLSKSIQDLNAEEALKNILVDQFELIDSIKMIETKDKIVISLSGNKIETNLPKVKNIIGSFPISLAGCILSNVINKPIIFNEEENNGKIITATFEMPIKNG
jgi:hypothetical protein